jgi:hypothetical protein
MNARLLRKPESVGRNLPRLSNREAQQAAKGQERLPWPGTAIYPNFEAFKTERLIPQNQDYLED